MLYVDSLRIDTSLSDTGEISGLMDGQNAMEAAHQYLDAEAALSLVSQVIKTSLFHLTCVFESGLPMESMKH